jgi:hypothetical protein
MLQAWGQALIPQKELLLITSCVRMGCASYEWHVLESVSPNRSSQKCGSRLPSHKSSTAEERRDLLDVEAKHGAAQSTYKNTTAEVKGKLPIIQRLRSTSRV